MEPSLQQATLVDYCGQRSDDAAEGQGRPHGRGRAAFSSGQVYDGEWQHGHMHGHGTLAFPDGVTWEGSMCSDGITGSGVYCWSGAVYEGEVAGGLRHGSGTQRLTDGPVYEGAWQQGRRHGKGVLFYNAERTAYYDGEWVADERHGQGCSRYPSGNTYKGAWAHDRQEGRGTMVWADRGQTYGGQWVRGQPHGLGEHVWLQRGVEAPSGQARGAAGGSHAVHVMHNRYVGMFEEGQRHGEGTLFYSNGARYEGGWRAGRKHGHGVYVFEDGTVFAGPFEEDRPDVAAGAMLGAHSTFQALLGHDDGGGGAPGSEPGGRTSSSRGGSMSGGGSVGTTPRSAREAGSKPATAAAAAAATDPPPGSAAAAADSGRVPPQPSTRKGAQATPAASGKAKGRPAAANTPTAAGSKAVAAADTAPAAAATAGGGARPAGTGVGAAAGAGAGSTAGPGGQWPGFGPPAFSVQLYIGDVLQEYGGDPAATYKAVVNLLVMHNTELRTLYDTYSAHSSPFTSAEATTTTAAGSSSWALRAGQLWELLADAKLLCRTVQLKTACQLLQKVITPPPVVMQRRQQVLLTPHAAAVVQQPQHPYDPDTPLLFRDFCELLVRLAAARYTGLPALEQQLQRVLAGHLLPLLGGGTASRQLAGGARASLLSASAQAQAAAGPAAAAAATGGPRCTGSHHLAWLREPEALELLRCHAGALQRLYADMAAAAQGDGVPRGAQHTAGAAVASASSAATSGEQPANCSSSSSSSDAWLHRSLTVRQVVLHLQATGALSRWQLGPDDLAAALLHTTLATYELQEARACIAAADPQATADEGGPGDAAPLGRSSPPNHQQNQDLMFWMDCELLLPEVVWGLARLAAQASDSESPHSAAAAVPRPGAQQAGPGGPEVGPLGRLQAILGEHGLRLHLVAGASTLPAGAGWEAAASGAARPAATAAAGVGDGVASAGGGAAADDGGSVQLQLPQQRRQDGALSPVQSIEEEGCDEDAVMSGGDSSDGDGGGGGDDDDDDDAHSRAVEGSEGPSDENNAVAAGS